MANRRRIIPVSLAVVVVVLGGGWMINRYQSSGSNQIFISGNIELTQVNIAFKVPGKLVLRAVDEGDAVKKGMLIARLDQEQLLSERDRAQAVLAATQSQLAQLQTDIQYQREHIDAEFQQRQAELEQAEAQLRDLLAGSRTQEVEQARAEVARAKSEHERAQADFARAQMLYKAAVISASQFDQFRTVAESTQAQLRQAQEQFALVVEGPRKEAIEAARQQVARAKAGLRQAEALKIDLKRREQQLESLRADVERAKADLAIIETQLNDTVAASPIDGVVLVKSAEPGEVLAAGTTVVTIGDLDHPWLRGYLNEQDLGRVKLGDKVRVKSDSFPGKEYAGRVSFIASEAEFTPKQIQTLEERVKLVYRIKVDIANPQHELKSNMPVEGEIVLKQ